MARVKLFDAGGQVVLLEASREDKKVDRDPE
jgi:hypothetical protein